MTRSLLSRFDIVEEMLQRNSFANSSERRRFHRCAHFTLRGAVMPKQPTNSGASWSPQDIKLLKQLAKENTPTRVMGLKLGRTAGAVAQKASSLGVSLKPTNQSPYNRQPKKR
jgi:hypothetical protein